MEVAWKFMPSDVIGGDIFNVFHLNEDYLALYMLDVSGHGVPSALVTVSVSQMLQPHSDGILKKRILSPPYYRILRPREVLRFLEREYPVERFKKFFTVIYAIVHTGEGKLTYSSAGHPQPILLHPNGDLEFLEKGGPIIGLGGAIPFEEEKRTLQFGDILIFYTDGVIEFQNVEGAFYGMDRFCELLKRHIHLPVERILDTVIDHLFEFGKGAKLRDDVSLLGIQYKGGGEHDIRRQVHRRNPGRQAPG
jgi:sigma-B regulation protein RsbU (phosphoserine phosphatase)